MSPGMRVTVIEGVEGEGESIRRGRFGMLSSEEER